MAEPITWDNSKINVNAAVFYQQSIIHKGPVWRIEGREKNNVEWGVRP